MNQSWSYLLYLKKFQVAVELLVFRLEGDASWALEVVDEYNNSTVWDDTFETDSAALTEAKKTILADGVKTLIGPEDGKSKGRWK